MNESASSAIVRSAPAWALLATSLVACGQSQADPQHTAETVTRAVYDNDLDTTISSFDDQTKKTVTRQQLGDLSDRMHALGEFTALSPRSASPDTGKYEYDAHFSSGAMLVQLRIDPSGKVGAYRVVPETPPEASAPQPSPNG